MKVAVIGSRNGFSDSKVYFRLCELIRQGDTLITGGASGIDTYAERFALATGIDIEIIRPINPSNKLDYLFRNVEIITKADKIIAFWDGKSRGTKFVIDYARARNKDLVVEYLDDQSL